jgi:hypothetical protein
MQNEPLTRANGGWVGKAGSASFFASFSQTRSRRLNLACEEMLPLKNQNFTAVQQPLSKRSKSAQVAGGRWWFGAAPSGTGIRLSRVPVAVSSRPAGLSELLAFKKLSANCQSPVASYRNDFNKQTGCLVSCWAVGCKPCKAAAVNAANRGVLANTGLRVVN